MFSFSEFFLCKEICVRYHDCDEFIMSEDWVTLFSVIERVGGYY